MKHHFKIAATLLIGILLIIGIRNAQGETLQDAIKFIIETNPDVRAVAYNRLARDQEVVQAKAGYFPTLDTSLSTGYQYWDHPFTDRLWPKTAMISLRQNVFRGGATRSEVNRQQARVDSEAYLLQGTSENIALQACRVYLNVLRTLELDDLAKENLTIHERLCDQIKLRSAAGVDRKVDLEQVTARLALAQSNLVVTNANVVDARTDYLAVIGRLPMDLVKPVAVATSIPATMEDAEQLALSNYPLVKSANADLEARKFQHQTAQALLYPSIDIAADYAWNHDTNISDAFRNEEYFIVTAMLRFNIFNGLQNKARIKETAYLISEGREIANKTERQTIQSIRLSYEAYKTAQGRVTQLEEYMKATGLTVEAFTSQWSIGRRTLFDVLDTQAEHINAKADLIMAQYDKMYAQYRILSGLGSLVSTMGLQWPEESHVQNKLK